MIYTFMILTVPALVIIKKNIDKQFYCGHNIFTKGVFVGTQLCSDAEISVRRIVRVTTNCCFASEI